MERLRHDGEGWVYERVGVDGAPLEVKRIDEREAREILLKYMPEDKANVVLRERMTVEVMGDSLRGEYAVRAFRMGETARFIGVKLNQRSGSARVVEFYIDRGGLIASASESIYRIEGRNRLKFVATTSTRRISWMI